MINKLDGTLIINDQLRFTPNSTFQDFMKTPFYKGQDKVRVIYLDEKQQIDNKEFLVNFFFRDDKIYVVTLVAWDENISEKQEPQRKLIHDKILLDNHIQNGKEYPWGKVVSEYDARSNISGISIFYT